MDGSIYSYIAAASAALGAVGLVSWRLQSASRTFGSSHWLTIFQAYRKGLFRKRGIMVGDWAGLLPVYYDGTHAITYGPAGSGKGTTVILPNLLSYRFIFLNDPGGENTAVAIKLWRALGYEVFVINPFGMHTEAPWELPVHAFNPFDFLDPASSTFSADAKLLAEILTPRTGRESGSNKYFMDRAQSFMHGGIVHIATTEPPERRNLGTLYDYVHQNVAGWDKLLKAMKANTAHGTVVPASAIDMERMEQQSQPEFSGVFSTVQHNLDWLAEPLARAAVSRSDVDFNALKGLKGRSAPGLRGRLFGKKPAGAVVATVMPVAYKETHNAIPRLSLQCAVWAMERPPLARSKVLFEIDEAASLGRLPHLPQWLAELRKVRVQWSLYFQNIAQPKYLYEKEWQTFQGNAGLKRFLAFRDEETAREASLYAGRATISVKSRSSNGGYTTSESGRELMMMDELLRLHENYMIAFVENLHTAILRKTHYWDRPENAGKYNPNPYFDGTKRASFKTPFKRLWGRLNYCAAWLLTPSPTAALLIVGAIVLAALKYTGEG